VKSFTDFAEEFAIRIIVVRRSCNDDALALAAEASLLRPLRQKNRKRFCGSAGVCFLLQSAARRTGLNEGGLNFIFTQPTDNLHAAI